jgi:peptide/nickel transport system permease protein
MGRFAFVVRRLLQLIPLLLGVTFLVFMLLKISPGDPARLILGLRASNEQVAQLRKQLGLDQGLLQQYLRYVGGLLHGDLGTSIRSGQPVTQIVANRLPVTLALLAAGSLVAVPLSILLAVVAALRRHRPVDHVIRILGVVGLAIPAFWLGVMAIAFVAIPTGWFRASGLGDGPVEFARGIILPGLVLGIGLTPVLVRSLRSELITVQSSDYLAMAKSVGVRGHRLVTRHALRNSVLPLVTLFAVQIGFALFGAMVIENTFALPGLGQAMVSAAGNRDFPVVQGITLVFAVMVVLFTLVADIAYAVIDPRVEIR